MSLLQALAIVSATLLVLGLISGAIKNRLFISETALALLVGAAMGPFLGNLMVPGGPLASSRELLMEVARVTLCIAVMGAALRLPVGYVRHHAGELALVLTIGMLGMWAFSSAAALLLAVPVLTALIIGAAVAPTDPVLAHSIVTGNTAQRSVPARMRHSLTAESGANDGLGLVFLMLPLTLLQHPPVDALEHWLLVVLAKEVLGGVVLGLAVGAASGVALRWYCRQEFHEETSVLTVSVALTFTVLTLARLLGLDGILAVFVAGLLLKRSLCDQDAVDSESTEEAIGRFFNIPVFILFGALLPWSDWLALGWRGAAAVALILLLRRLPVWALLRPGLPSVSTRGELAYNGWFGPIGVAALFYSLLAAQHTGQTIVWVVVSLVVFASAMVHGVTATPLTRLLARRPASTARL